MTMKKKAERLTPLQKAKAETHEIWQNWNRAMYELRAEQHKCAKLEAALDAARQREKATEAALDQLRSHIYVFSSALRRDADKDRATSHVSVEMLMMLAQLVPVVSGDQASSDQCGSITNAAKAA